MGLKFKVYHTLSKPGKSLLGKGEGKAASSISAQTNSPVFAKIPPLGRSEDSGGCLGQVG